MKKITAIILAVIMLCGCAAGCSGSEEDTVMTVNGFDVSFDEYMTWLGSAVSRISTAATPARAWTGTAASCLTTASPTPSGA